MTDEQKIQYLKDWAIGWANNEDIEDSSELELFIDDVMGDVALSGKQSESLGDYSVSYSVDDLRNKAMKYLGRYKRLRW